MPRMIDLVRKSAVSSNVMFAAARGALAVPPGEMMEILVHLANHNKVFGQQARMTLAGWDEKASRLVAADPATPREVLEYMISPQNLRMPLLPALLENESITEEFLLPLASGGSREVVEAFRHGTRVKTLPGVMTALRSNPNFDARDSGPSPAQSDGAAVSSGSEDARDEETTAESGPAAVETGEELPVGDEVVESFLSEHAAELAAEADKPFQPIGGVYGEEDPGSLPESHLEQKEEPQSEQAKSGPAQETHAHTAPRPKPVQKPVAARPGQGARKPAPSGGDEKRDSTLQKIAKLDIKGRIQLAIKGTKEERGLLIRDGTKLVALAVLDSPKITDGEVEKIASQKNVLEAVLRAIPMKRRYAKQYTIIRNLVFNPRTPLDVSLGLMKNLMVNDLKNLSGNKEVADTIRKLALRMFKQKVESAGKKN